MTDKGIEGKLGTSVKRFFCEIGPYLPVTNNANRFTDHIEVLSRIGAGPVPG